MDAISGTKYTSEWFKERAFSAIQPIAPHIWDYSDSLLLYVASGVEKYESLQETQTPYYKLVTLPEQKYLQSITKSVVDLLPEKIEYIDLGPGTEHKEQFFFDELKRQGKDFLYTPVDISEHYLSLAEKHASKQGISVHPIQASFEELPDILGEATIPRFVNIGLTFSNYDPQTILSLLKRIAGKNGYAFVNAQIRDRVDMVALEKIYVEDAVTVADDKLRLLGLDPTRDVTPREASGEIKVWCGIIHASRELNERGIVDGDKLLVFQSLRYTVEQFQSELSKASEKNQLFDTGSSFIAGIIYT